MAYPTALRNEVATISKDITFPTFGGVMYPNDDTLLARGAGAGLKIYDQIERDSHAFAVLQKRKMAIIGKEWDVEPASNRLKDKKIAELVKWQLENLSMDGPDDEVLPQCSGFDQMCLNLLDAILKGYAVGEIIWGSDGGEIVAREVRAKEQRRFLFTPGTTGFKLNLKTWQNMLPGEPVPPRKFIVHSCGAKDGNPYGLGLGTRLFWPVLFKRQDITFWLTFVDKFASPTAKGTYPSGTTPEDKAKLLGSLSALSQETGIIVPEGMSIELIEAARSGSIDSYERLARYMDEQISECVLGETGSTNQSNGGGSRARDEVGNSVRLELVKADADLLSATLNSTLIKWISQLNDATATPPKVWRDCGEPEDLKVKAERDGLLSKECGVMFSGTYFEREYGFEAGDIVSVNPNPNPPNPLGPRGSPLTKGGFKAPPFVKDPLGPKGGGGGISFAESPDTLALLADHHAAAADPALSQWVDQLRGIMNSAVDLAEMKDSVLAAFPGLPVEEMARILAEESIRAQMAGRLDVRNHD